MGNWVKFGWGFLVTMGELAKESASMLYDSKWPSLEMCYRKQGPWHLQRHLSIFGAINITDTHETTTEDTRVPCRGGWMRDRALEKWRRIQKAGGLRFENKDDSIESENCIIA